MALNKTYFETKGRDVTTPIPDTPGYTPPVVPAPPTPGSGSTPNIPRPTFSGNTTVTLYNYSGEKNLMDKGSLLTAVFTADIVIKDTCDLLNPAIYLNTSTDIKDCNYMSMLGRYYYIIEKTLVEGNLYIIKAHEDVLYTYKNAILAHEAIIARQQSTYNLYLDDGMYKVTGQVVERTLLFSGNPLTKNLQYVLLTTGGRATANSAQGGINNVND